MKTINIWPRQTGKTTTIFNKCKDNDIIIVPNQLCKKSLKYHGHYRLHSASELLNFNYDHFRGCDFKNRTIYIDEWYFWQNRQEHYKCLTDLYNKNDLNLEIYTTSNKLYREDIFDFVKFFKKHRYTNVSNNMFPEEYFDELYFDFSTDLNTEIKFYKPNFDILSKEQYLTEIKGKFFNY